VPRASYIAFLLTIAATVLPFGGVQPIAYSITMLGVAAALLLVLFSPRGGGRRRQATPGRFPGVPVWPVLFLLLVALQLVPLPTGLIGSLASARPLPASLARIIGAQQGWTPISIDAHATVIMLLKITTYLVAFLLAAYFFDSTRRKSGIIALLIALGAVEAGYGMVQYLTGLQKIFTVTKQAYTEDATGTYINHNHFAGFLELCIPFALAMAYYFFQFWSAERSGARGRRRRQAAAGGMESAGPQVVFFTLLVVTMLVAAVLSRSRSGIIALLLSVLFIAVLAQLTTRSKTWILGILLLLLCVVGYGLWIGLGPVLLRFEQLHATGYLQAEGRISTLRDGLHLLRDYPVLGTGLGTFGLAFRHYQTGMVNYFFDHAHDDYLEFATDTGLLGAALLFLPIVYLFVRMIFSFIADDRRYRRAVVLGCIGATAAMLIHSAADFNLQIPANALGFAVVLGIGYKAALLEPHGMKAPPAEIPAAVRAPSVVT
jgi:O-antigen ligase